MVALSEMVVLMVMDRIHLDKGLYALLPASENPGAFGFVVVMLVAEFGLRGGFEELQHVAETEEALGEYIRGVTVMMGLAAGMVVADSFLNVGLN